MFGKIRQKKAEKLKAQIAIADARLALTKAEIAAQLIKLAGQTSDVALLKEADESLTIAREFFGFENAPIEICLVQVALGDMFFTLGRKASDRGVMIQAKAAYRTAITMASLQGDEALRTDLRAKVKLVDSLLGQGPKTPSLFRAA